MSESRLHPPDLGISHLPSCFDPGQECNPDGNGPYFHLYQKAQARWVMEAQEAIDSGRFRGPRGYQLPSVGWDFQAPDPDGGERIRRGSSFLRPGKQRAKIFGTFDMNAALERHAESKRAAKPQQSDTLGQPFAPRSVFVNGTGSEQSHYQQDYLPMRPKPLWPARYNDRTKRLGETWRAWNLPELPPGYLTSVELLGRGSSGAAMRVLISPHSSLPEDLVKRRYTACKIFARGHAESGAVEVAAFKAFKKLAESQQTEDGAVAWATDHIVQLVGRTLEPSDQRVSPSLHTELCEGGEVMNYLRKKQSSASKLRGQFGAELMKATHACHVAGIVHLDIKVENCFIALSNGKPTLKLGDFGGAMMYPQVGSPPACTFPPPEVALCETKAPLSPAWDIWASGIAVAVILGAKKEVVTAYQNSTMERVQMSATTLHTMDGIMALRSRLLDPQSWVLRPSERVGWWLSAALYYDPANGVHQTRPTAHQLLEQLP